MHKPEKPAELENELRFWHNASIIITHLNDSFENSFGYKIRKPQCTLSCTSSPLDTNFLMLWYGGVKRCNALCDKLRFADISCSQYSDEMLGERKEARTQLGLGLGDGCIAHDCHLPFILFPPKSAIRSSQTKKKVVTKVTRQCFNVNKYSIPWWMSVVSPTSRFAYKSIRLHRGRFAYTTKSFR